MKTIQYFVLAIVLSLPSALCSQEQQPAEQTTSHDAKKRVVPAIKVGMTRSNVYDREGEEFVSESKSGFAGGVSLALPLGSLLGIQPELLLLQKGFRGAGRIQGEQYMIDRTTTHIDLPIQLQFKPFKWLTFLGGPQWSFVLKSDDRYSLGNNTIAQKQIENSDVRENLFGTLIGLDLNFGHVVLSARSGWDVSANHSHSASTSPRYRNSWMIYSIGYRFY